MSSYYEKITATGEVKCIDEEIPFEIPQRWEWCRMGSIGDWGAGATPAKGNPDYYGGSILWLRTGELNNGIVYDSEIKVTKKALQKCSLRMNRIGDVLIAMYGATIGKVAIVGKELTTNQACCACTPFGIYNYFLFFFLMGSQIDFIKKGEGGAQPNISREKLVSHLMPIPPLAEQYRIVEKIQYLLPLVEKYSDGQILQDKLNSEIKDKLRKSILQEAIQGKLVPQIAEEGTAEELLEQIKTEKQKLVKEGKLKKTALNDSVIFRGDDNKYWEKNGISVACIDDEIPFEIPSTWIWCRLGDCVKIIGGYAFKSYELKSPVGYRVIRISDISENGLVNKNIVKYSGNENLDQYLIKENDILIAMTGGTVGKSLLLNNALNEPLLLNQRVAIIRNFWINVEYLNTFLHSPYIKQIIDKKKNSTNDNISMSDLNDFLLPLPPLKEQHRIVEKFKNVTSIMSR